MSKSTIAVFEKRGEIGIISLSNGKENYLIEPEFVELRDLVEWTFDNTLKGIIITGAGRNFSAGADKKELLKLAENEKNLSDKIAMGKQILDYIENLTIPVVASIQGVCFGGGLEIALACHMRIASPNALFAFPEVNLGLIPGLGGIYRLIQLVDHREVYNMILAGDMINSEYAKNISLVDFITNSKDPINEAYDKLVALTHDRSPDLIRNVVSAINNARKLDPIEALKIETEMFCRLAIKVKDSTQE